MMTKFTGVDLIALNLTFDWLDLKSWKLLFRFSHLFGDIKL